MKIHFIPKYKGRHTHVHRPLKIVVGMPYSEAKDRGHPAKDNPRPGG